ncbi:hypothetical protein [Reichenbachiella sp. MALMAid0571]|uniref:bZIP transcription factor n=1 Tax=Reichenbachiella sp. MALMAid0571 TaxID=3143939 RepID=UPI0032E05147
MKKIGLLLCGIIISNWCLGQVNDTGGNVAIGNHSPSTKLHVVDNSSGEVLRVESSTTSSQIKLRATATGGIDWSLMSTANGASLGGGKFSIYGNSQHRFVLDNQGFLGLGSTSPAEKLHIEGGALQFLNVGENLNNVDIVKIGEGSTANEFSLVGMFAGTGESGNALKFRSSWNDNLLYLRGDNKIGIGTSEPLERLHIESGALQFLNVGENQDNVDIIKLGEGISANEFSLTGMFAGTGESGNAIKFKSMWNDNLLVIRGNGEIGIGTALTGPHKLAVEGSIGAREIKVETTTWSDFVFENDYELRTLEEVEQHITEKGHLPEIPSEEEVTENGINLGEMDAKLLQKIEELTLYMIEMNKRLGQLEEENGELKKEISTLKKE